ncbi:hypothetical protein [Nocardia sp. NBC_01009]|uniref:hypothetical protein n=1 Tax=Nocardia sp. NBC_01009 TaxID=2975996 RepID=UPI003869C262|nr:hypothetical protein OHA42_09650 [Nocardia sp. NBC_01009]
MTRPGDEVPDNQARDESDPGHEGAGAVPPGEHGVEAAAEPGDDNADVTGGLAADGTFNDRGSDDRTPVGWTSDSQTFDDRAPIEQPSDERASAGRASDDQVSVGRGPDDQVSAGRGPDERASADRGPDDQASVSPTPEATPDTDADFMAEFMKSFEEQAGDDPDVGFSLVESAPTVDVAERAKQVSHQIARSLATLGPRGWRQLEAVFVLTTDAELAQVVFADDQQRSARVQPTDEVLALVREQRHVSAQLSDGPWWRLLLTLSSAGEIEVDYDYGDEPFPDDQLFPPEVYLADMEVYPHDSLPVWLAAYVGHGDRQSRPAQVAAAQARADRENGVRGVLSERDFPALPIMSARWAVIAAAFVAAGSEWGPRVLPALNWFEGAKRSGSTLYALPGGRAVLSGGVWNAPELDAAYNRDEPLPDVYAGAPEWVANPVLNPRAANGLLSFCYWWEGGNWYRGDSPGSDQLAAAIPGVWSTETVVDVVSGLVADELTDQQRAAVATLVSAAEVGVVTRDTIVGVFGADSTFDIDSALYQLMLAGVTMTLPEPMPQEDAIAQVRQFILDQGMDTTGYPLQDLRADRINVGWMVYVPTRPGEISIGRAIFYIADDGVLEQSSSSVAPTVYITEFERRFQQRHGSVQA